MRFCIIFFTFMLLFPLVAIAEDTSAPMTKEECEKFYDDHKALAEQELANYDEEEIQKLEESGDINAAWGSALKQFKPLFEISDKAKLCGTHDKRFFNAQRRLCSMFARGPDSWGNIGRAYMFENVAIPFFCSHALNRGDLNAFMDVLQYYLRGYGGERDYAGAIKHIDDFVSMHPESKDLIFFIKTPIYQRGGYGVKKDEKKAFEIWKEHYGTGSKDDKGGVACQLSLYYRNGIGTKKNQHKADELLAISKEKNPKRDCKHSNFDFLFAPTGLEKELMKSEE